MRQLLKQLMINCPVSKPLFAALRGKPIPAEMYRYMRFKGPFQLTAASGEHFQMFSHGSGMENELFWSGLDGNWEGTSLDIWQRLCAESDCVADIGANVGVYSLLAKAVNPRMAVYAFEPVDHIRKRLTQNVNLNEFAIRVLDAAISDTDGEATIYASPIPGAGTSSLVEGRSVKNTDASVVKIQRLDTLINEGAIAQPDLIKIDVELHEGAVFRGMRNTLVNAPSVLVEVLRQNIADEINQCIEAVGYEIYAVDEQERTLKRIPSVMPGMAQGDNVLLVSPAVFERCKLFELTDLAS